MGEDGVLAEYLRGISAIPMEIRVITVPWQKSAFNSNKRRNKLL